MQRAGLQIRGKNAAGFQKGIHDAEEMLYSSASQQQNMNFDLKSVLDAEDMSVSSASYSASNNQISQQQSDQSATIR